MPQLLTVLLSYDFEASVPLWNPVVKFRMATVRAELNGPEGVHDMPSVYASWVGQAVVLQVATGDLRVPLPRNHRRGVGKKPFGFASVMPGILIFISR